ncbi:MAG: TonB family protein [Candidatus Zixiibacteriota bacterium]|nr:MAG: TonB family protein [candidate division Zixibacteria bacterium]
MKWAVISSFIIHGFFFGFILKNDSEKMNKYPPVMMVRLASPPPVRGVQKPAAKTPLETTQKKTAKIETPETEARIAEVNKRKKPKRKQADSKPASETKEQSQTQETINQKKGLPDGVDLGSEFGSARIDAAGFDSPYYLNIVFSKIRRGWDNPFEGLDTVHCTIYFVIDRRGRISDSAIENSSGMPAYDQAALRAVLGSKPPPLPNQFGSEELGIHLEFRYIPYN